MTTDDSTAENAWEEHFARIAPYSSEPGKYPDAEGRGQMYKLGFMAGRASRDTEVAELRCNWENDCGHLERAESTVESLREENRKLLIEGEPHRRQNRRLKHFIAEVESLRGEATKLREQGVQARTQLAKVNEQLAAYESAELPPFIQGDRAIRAWRRIITERAEAQATIAKVRAAIPLHFRDGTEFMYELNDEEKALRKIAILSAPSSTGGGALADVKAQAVHEAAEAIRHHCTAPFELTNPIVQIDALIAWVADWIENPPEWVEVSYRKGNDHE